ncbi:MAG TPA: ABC transporter permease [Gemmatimonadales bacterium]|nr:ABC transporter permease [Gemmatimonadales bacterium]
MSSTSPSVFASVIGLWSRDAAVMRRELLPFVLRVVANPLLTVFVFTYVLPKSGQVMPTAAGAGSFATVLVPGLVAVAMMFTAISAVALPLSVELGATREIEDRVLAPIPLRTVPLAKVAFGAFQGILAGAAIFPILLVLPATEVAVRVASWPMLIIMLLLASWTGAAMGLFLGTAIRPQQIGLMFAVVLTPMTFLGCVYYPWASLAAIPWLQTAVLANPLVYMTEGLRIALTPDVPHLAPLVTATMLTLLGIGLTALGVRGFIRRVVG